METNKTDKKILIQGLKTLLFALITIFVGPMFLNIAFSNKCKPLYIPILIVGCLISVMAIFLIFKGIKTIMNSMFKKNN